VYPPLVEQAYSMMKQNGINDVSKAEIYSKMVETNLIDQNGDPTEFALKNGLVDDATEKSKMSLLQFKKMYPVFKGFPAKEFWRSSNGFWYISENVMDSLEKRCSAGNSSEDDKKQLARYFSLRNYDDPQTIAELKGVMPEYRDFDDSCFHETDHGVSIEMEAVIQICEKVLSGKISGDKAMAKEFIDKYK
ncbi:hypothetical protein, partial [Liquorilactobacillus satsumensis]|uniref:hypothetical protein n=1 Tax=Liquorilactobacillus satsumensis TaxID=259059 RepID=UPI0039EC966B